MFSITMTITVRWNIIQIIAFTSFYRRLRNYGSCLLSRPRPVIVTWPSVMLLAPNKFLTLLDTLLTPLVYAIFSCTPRITHIDITRVSVKIQAHENCILSSRRQRCFHGRYFSISGSINPIWRLTAIFDIQNGHNFATGFPIDVMFGSRVGFPAELRFLP